jgi:hypothetical protein
VLVDRDVASYYPSVILRCKLYPKHMGEKFLEVYGDIVKRRLDAKKRGDAVVRDSLKIVLNGSFGKFGSKFSILYSPDLLIQTTLTGQLALLMLIEQLELNHIPVISANTDGIVIKCPRHMIAVMNAVIGIWEYWSAFETEETQYLALYSKDVNNYLAIKPDGKTKAKGLYAAPGLTKNPTASIAVDAVTAHLVSGADVMATIAACKDITKFVRIRSVKGGGVQADRYLGKTVRWYYSTAMLGKTINYKSNGNIVPMSEGARATMELPKTFPEDINYAVYADQVHSILQVIGAVPCSSPAKPTNKRKRVAKANATECSIA